MTDRIIATPSTGAGAGKAAGVTRLRPLLGPSAMAFVMLLILLALGAWQVRRLAWKQGILAHIAAAEAAAPIPLPAAPGPFQKVSASGRFLPGPTGSYGVAVHDTPAGPVMGWQLLAPFATGGRIVLVDRGWVPEKTSVPTPAGTVTVVGYVRQPEHPRMLGASDDPVRRQFFTLDPAAIGAALGQPAVAPFTLVALGPEQPGVLPEPAQQLPRPPNNHLLYAITWFGLAGVLVVMFASWVRKRASA
jgi:surfeit locus 1 family protein